MHQKTAITLNIATAVLLIGMSLPAQADQEEFVVSDFDKDGLVIARGETWEVWLKGAGDDPTQTCAVSLAEDDALGEAGGTSLRLDYDVDSENAAYNGARVALGGFDASGFKTLSLYVKGDPAAGFTKKLKIELIGETRRPSPYILTGITGEWQKFTVPLEEFWAVSDWTSLYQFVVVFDDINSDPKTGAIFVDQIVFA